MNGLLLFPPNYNMSQLYGFKNIPMYPGMEDLNNPQSNSLNLSYYRYDMNPSNIMY